MTEQKKDVILKFRVSGLESDALDKYVTENSTTRSKVLRNEFQNFLKKIKKDVATAK